MSDETGGAAPRRVALVTGASRGIGEESAVALARAGFDVALAASTGSRGPRSGARPRAPAPS
jgi:NAD(P)-dependent dehydrogenase (short-subunit alcohol dehydrogenase family)